MLQSVVAAGHIDWPWPEVAHCRTKLFDEAIVCSDTDVEKNCLPVADSVDFLLSDPIPQVRRERFYFLFTLTTQF